MPRFAEQTFTHWHYRATGIAKVMLYPDPFNNYFFPETLRAALNVLGHYGYRVLIPEHVPPAVRPPLDYGMLDYARGQILEAVELLEPFVRAGIPVVILEPSTAAIFRDELPEMFPQHEDGRRVTQLTMLLSEFMVREKLSPPQWSGRVIYHGHCHQKAVLDPQAAHQILQEMGMQVEEPQKGCCGMAGSFGFEQGKYDISMAIGEMQLLPAVREASSGTYIVADGFSCRTQIMEGTGKKVLHLSELLQQAMKITTRSASMSSKDSRVVVITGASAGLGRATAHAFAREGARIGLISRNRERLEAARAEVEALGGSAMILVADVADPEQLERAASQVEQEFGPIDVWVNNAMTSVFSPFSAMTADEFRRVTEVTYLGVVYGTMAALRRMLPRKQGVIVQVGSALAERSIPLQAAYCGAKHGIRGFTDSIRCELLHEKSPVHITMVQLPAMNTPQFNWVKSRLPNKPQPVPPIFQPEVAADAIVWASRNRRREIYVGLPTVKAMWGNKFFAGLLDWYLAKTGYKSQQTDQPEQPDRPSNLWETVPGDYSAHGDFDEIAKSCSPGMWFVKNKWLIGGIAAGCFLAAALATASRPKRGFRRLSAVFH